VSAYRAVSVSDPVKLRQFAIRLLLAFSLLLSQQLGMAHAVTHLSSDLSSSGGHDKQLPCAQCHAFASIGAGLVSPPFSWLAALDSQWVFVAAPDALPLRRLIRAFDSRAPPAVS
jgi:hypothetical protein